MDSITSSLQLGGIVSGTILATVMLAMGVSRVGGFVGYPIGDWLVRRLPHPETMSEQEHYKAARATSGVVGVGLSWAFTQYHVASPVGFPHERPNTLHHWYVLIGLWFVQTALQGCFEAGMVLALLSGVVKLFGRGPERVAPADIARFGERGSSGDAEKEGNSAV